MPQQTVKYLTRTPLIVLSQTFMEYCYKGNIPITEVLTAWGIKISSKGAETDYVRLTNVNPLWSFQPLANFAFCLKDENGLFRLSFMKSPFDDRLCTKIHSPLDVTSNGDESMFWVEVTHHDEVVFKTDKIKDCNLDNDARYEHAVIFQEAVEYVQKHYPLAFSDPLAYW